jgi:copper chaperone CopZ
MKNVTFKVHGMHCDGCAQIVQSLLERNEGVQTCAVSYSDSTARVMFDPARTDEAKMRGAIEKAGYRVESGPDAKAGAAA